MFALCLTDVAIRYVDDDTTIATLRPLLTMLLLTSHTGSLKNNGTVIVCASRHQRASAARRKTSTTVRMNAYAARTEPALRMSL